MKPRVDAKGLNSEQLQEAIDTYVQRQSMTLGDIQGLRKKILAEIMLIDGEAAHDYVRHIKRTWPELIQNILKEDD